MATPAPSFRLGIHTTPKLPLKDMHKDNYMRIVAQYIVVVNYTNLNIVFYSNTNTTQKNLQKTVTHPLCLSASHTSRYLIKLEKIL